LKMEKWVRVGSGDRRPIRFEVRIRILTPDSTRDSIRTQTADSQVPTLSVLKGHFPTESLSSATVCISGMLRGSSAFAELLVMLSAL